VQRGFSEAAKQRHGAVTACFTGHASLPGMTQGNRRDFLRGLAAAASTGATLALFPPSIRKALAIPAHRRTGTLQDVEHVVILMQENRSFDHYFGTLRGVRGFGDRFPVPVPNLPGRTGKTVWYQANGKSAPDPSLVAPFRLDTAESFGLMRVSGTPHTWPDAQLAWADGKLSEWARYKNDHALGYFAREDIPFQFALAEAFTLCDAYHCAFHGGTNPNRVFLWTGNNDPLATGNGPVINNNYDNLEHDPDGGYTWVTYCERLQKAGVRWQVYENMDDNFTDNPLAGFRRFRAAYAGLPGSLTALKERGLSTRDLELLRDDVIEDRLPEVSWIVATAEGSEHPGPSSPAQGADYTARVLEALTANPDVWAKTVLFVNFDENDGFFDHVPPPAVPSYQVYSTDPRSALLAGDSTVETRGEYHEHLAPDVDELGRTLQHKPYGLGPRVPLYVVSPWSKGGFVNSELADHTSVIRFLERRFGVLEPNISPWRRAVCSDLTSTFNFAEPDGEDFYDDLPETSELAERARALPAHETPLTPPLPALPGQERGVRRARALPYVLEVNARVQPGSQRITLSFENTGRQGAVFHVYDRKQLEAGPRRYTVEPRKGLTGHWELRDNSGAYDLWVLGPNGFHRHFTGVAPNESESPLSLPEIEVEQHTRLGSVSVRLLNRGAALTTFDIKANAYAPFSTRVRVAPYERADQHWPLRLSAQWYDFTVRVVELPGFSRRFAGHVETGRDSYSDPAFLALALGDQER
jgi:phospholipase C